MSLRTKRALEESFKELLKTKPISKISIKEITDNCKISRMTFYYHFTDIYDLARYVSEQDVLRSEKSSLADSKNYFYHVLNTFYADKEAANNIYNSIDGVSVKKYLCKSFEKTVKLVVEQAVSSRQFVGVNKEFVLAFCLNAVVGCVMDWFDNKMQETIDELADNLNLLVVRLVEGVSEEVI